VHCGKVGALMKLMACDASGKIAAIAQGKYSIEKRTRLQVLVHGKKPIYAMNELLLGPTEFGKIMAFEFWMNGKKIFSEESDGLIVATATGSTGHAYSAGGKKLKPKEKKLSVVSINSFNRKQKPFVAGPKASITVKVQGKSQIVADGQVKANAGKTIRVKIAKQPALFIKPR